MKLMVAVPTHGGALDSVAVETLLQLQSAALQRGYGFNVRMHSASVIHTLRNLIVADFLNDGADLLFMLDADQGVPAATVMRMIDWGRPIVGCIYPRRRFDWSRVNLHAASDLQSVIYQALDFVGEIEPSDVGGSHVVVEQGFAPARYVGAGALLIRRDVFTRLKAAYPELCGKGFRAGEHDPARFAENWGFFNPLEPVGDEAALSEDYSFCSRWRTCGGEIWADVVTPLAHAGRQVFSGAYAEYLNAVSPR